MCSLVESEHPVADAGPPGADKREAPETSVVLRYPSHDRLMRAIAERSVSTHLAVAEFEVAAL